MLEIDGDDEGEHFVGREYLGSDRNHDNAHDRTVTVRWDSTSPIPAGDLDSGNSRLGNAQVLADPPTPAAIPEAPEFSSFTVTAVPLIDDEQPQLSEAGWSATDESEPSEDLEAEVRSDGTFHLQVPPGRYALEAISDDRLLVAGIEEIEAHAGDCHGDLDLTAQSAVAITGTVVDAAGVRRDSGLSIYRLHHRDVTTDAAFSGKFDLLGLRPGPYFVVAHVDGAPALPMRIIAPAAGVQLRVPSLAKGMLLISRDGKGTCPKGVILLSQLSKSREPATTRPASFVECRAIVDDVPPGSSWTVVRAAGFGGRDLMKQTITFDSGATPAPVCVIPPCESNAAAVHVRVIDSSGLLVTEYAEVSTGPADGPPVGSTVNTHTRGIRAWTTMGLRATSQDLSLSAEATFWVVPGVNEVDLHLPGELLFDLQ